MSDKKDFRKSGFPTSWPAPASQGSRRDSGSEESPGIPVKSSPNPAEKRHAASAGS